MVTSDLQTVHAFWYGPALGRVEQLSLASFVAQGHPTALWCYTEPAGVPSGVQVRPAAKILPESQVFRYEGRKRYWNRGSLAGFANWFRYELLYREGGFWVDVDMVCLKPFQFTSPRVFGREDDKAINVAVLGLPHGDLLAWWMARLCASPNTLMPYDSIRRRLDKLSRRFLEGNLRGNVQFGECGPRGLTEALQYFGLEDQAMPPDVFYPVHYWDWKQVFGPDVDWTDRLNNAHGIHLWNERMRQDPAFDKEAKHPEGCLFERLWQRYFAVETGRL